MVSFCIFKNRFKIKNNIKTAMPFIIFKRKCWALMERVFDHKVNGLLLKSCLHHITIFVNIIIVCSHGDLLQIRICSHLYDMSRRLIRLVHLGYKGRRYCRKYKARVCRLCRFFSEVLNFWTELYFCLRFVFLKKWT